MQSAAKLVRANSVFAIDQHPNGGHPFIQTKRGILKDRSHFDGELLLAAFAEPKQTSLDERVFVVPATWARDMSIRPAQIDRSDKCPLWITELNDSFLQAARCFHA